LSIFQSRTSTAGAPAWIPSKIEMRALRVVVDNGVVISFQFENLAECGAGSEREGEGAVEGGERPRPTAISRCHTNKISNYSTIINRKIHY
jgi:hypothetical protein